MLRILLIWLVGFCLLSWAQLSPDSTDSVDLVIGNGKSDIDTVDAVIGEVSAATDDENGLDTDTGENGSTSSDSEVGEDVVVKTALFTTTSSSLCKL